MTLNIINIMHNRNAEVVVTLFSLCCFGSTIVFLLPYSSVALLLMSLSFLFILQRYDCRNPFPATWCPSADVFYVIVTESNRYPRTRENLYRFDVDLTPHCVVRKDRTKEREAKICKSPSLATCQHRWHLSNKIICFFALHLIHRKKHLSNENHLLVSLTTFGSIKKYAVILQ